MKSPQSTQALSGTTLAAWAVGEVLARHPGLAIVPGVRGLVLRGTLRCWASGVDDYVVDETFQLEVLVPREFPMRLPRVYETAGRIPRTFHRLEDYALCLGSGVALRLAMGSAPTLVGFLDRVVVPYLYGFLHFEATGCMPLGELAHGVAGLEDDVRHLFNLPPNTDALGVLMLAGQRRRIANKRSCPCGSRRRLGRCHGHRINVLRSHLTRSWFKREAMDLRFQREREDSSAKMRHHAAPRWMRR